MTQSIRHIHRVARMGTALVVVVAAVSIVVLSNNEGVGEAIASMKWWAVLGTLALAAFSAFAEGAVLAVLNGDVRPRSILGMTRAYLSGGFLGSVTPYAIGGGPTWVWALAREGIDVGEAAALVTGRSIVTAVFFALVSVAAAVFASSTGGLARALLLGLLVPALTIAVLAFVARRPERAGETIARTLDRTGRRLGSRRLVGAAMRAPVEMQRFAEALRLLLGKRAGKLLAALLVVAVSRTSQLLAIPLLLVSQGYRLPASTIVTGLLLMWVIASVSPSPSGEGVAQAVLVAVFGNAVSIQGAAAAALVWRACMHYPLFLTGGLLFAKLVKGRPETAEEATPGLEAEAAGTG